MRICRKAFIAVGVCIVFALLLTIAEGKKKEEKKEEAPAKVDKQAPAKKGAKHAAVKDEDEDEDGGNNEDDTIEDVDEDKIDEIVDKNEQNLVVFFYDTRQKCPQCEEAMSELEEIDDDLEDVGTIEVVKTDDKNVAKELGIRTFPALVYFRRKNPILYDGDFKDSTEVLRWIRSHEEVVAVELDDDNFEDLTDSATPDERALDWFVMFYDEKDEGCSAYEAVWETVAYKLRGLVKVAKVDISESDDVAERFDVDDEDDECPTFILLRKGKMYTYKDTARDVKSFTSFALSRYKETRGHRVPDPPTLIEELYEEAKESLFDMFEENNYLLIAVVVGGGIIFVSSIAYGILKLLRRRRQKED